MLILPSFRRYHARFARPVWILKKSSFQGIALSG